MYFWGSYTFDKAESSVNVEERPPLRYPLHLPPTPRMLHLQNNNNNHSETAEMIQKNVPLKVLQVSCGHQHALALIQDHQNNVLLYGMGSNSAGQLGSAVDYTYTNTFKNLQRKSDDDSNPSNEEILTIACGKYYSLYLNKNGCVYACGDNRDGQLGLPDALCMNAKVKSNTKKKRNPKTEKEDPKKYNPLYNQGFCCCLSFTQILSLYHIVNIYTGSLGNLSFAVDAEGTLFSWGRADDGALGHPAEEVNNLNLININDAVRKNGYVRFEFDDQENENVELPKVIQYFKQKTNQNHKNTNVKSFVVDVSVGKSHTLFLQCSVVLPSTPINENSNSFQNNNNNNHYKIDPNDFTSVYQFYRQHVAHGNDLDFLLNYNNNNNNNFQIFTELYSCGEGTTGKLGHGDHDTVITPKRICKFPFQDETQNNHHNNDRHREYNMEDEYDHMLHHKNNNNTADAINAYFKNKTDEIIIDFAAGEDCSIVLTFTKTGGQPHQRCGTMLYYFGQLNNRESQPAPEVVYFANPHEVLRTRPPRDPATITKMENENYDFVNFYVDSNRTDFQEAVQHHFQNNNTNDNNKMISNENFVTHLFAGRGNLYYIKTRNDEVYYSSGKHNSRLVTHGGPSNTDLHNYKTFSLLKYVLQTHIHQICMGGTFIIATAYHNHHDSVSALRSSEEVRYLTKILGVQTYPLQNSEIEENENNQNNENNIPESCWEVSVPQNDRVYLLQGELRDDVRTQLYERSRRLFLLGWFEEDHHSFLQRDASSSSVSLLTDLYIERYLPPSAPLCDIGRTNHFQKLTDLKKEVTVGTKVRLWMTDVYALGTVVQVLEPKEEIKKEESNDEKNNNNHHSNHVTVCIEWLRDDWKEEVLSLHGSDQTLDRENDNRWQPLWYEQTSAGTEGDYVVDYTGVQGKR